MPSKHSTSSLPSGKRSVASTAHPASDVVLKSAAVLLRCADGSGLHDTSRHDSSLPHPHRPPLRSLHTFDDVLRSRIEALGTAILLATPTPVVSTAVVAPGKNAPQSSAAERSPAVLPPAVSTAPSPAPATKKASAASVSTPSPAPATKKTSAASVSTPTPTQATKKASVASVSTPPPAPATKKALAASVSTPTPTQATKKASVASVSTPTPTQATKKASVASVSTPAPAQATKKASVASVSAPAPTQATKKASVASVSTPAPAQATKKASAASVSAPAPTQATKKASVASVSTPAPAPATKKVSAPVTGKNVHVGASPAPSAKKAAVTVEKSAASSSSGSALQLRSSMAESPVDAAEIPPSAAVGPPGLSSTTHATQQLRVKPASPVVHFIEPEPVSSIHQDPEAPGQSLKQSLHIDRTTSTTPLVTVLPSSDSLRVNRSRTQSQESPPFAPVCQSTLSPTGNRALGSAAEQQRVIETDAMALNVLQQRSSGPGLVLASSAAPLYDQAYASYLVGRCGGAGHLSQGLGDDSFRAKRLASVVPTPSSSSTGTASRLPQYDRAIMTEDADGFLALRTLGGNAPSEASSPVLQHSPMSQEEVANALYLAAKVSRTSVERNYYQIMHILWQTPLRGNSLTMNTSRGGNDPLMSSTNGSSTHRRRRLEFMYVRDLYTRMPAASLLTLTSSSSLRSARYTARGGVPDSAKLNVSEIHRNLVRLSFLLRFELILMASGDIFPGRLTMPRGRFDVSVAPSVSSGTEKERQTNGELPSTARYADQCVDWIPLYPRLGGVHIHLPAKLINANPYLQDYAVVEGSIRPHHDHGGALNEEVPERIAYHLALGPSSLSSQLLPLLKSGNLTHAPMSPGYLSPSTQNEVLVMDTKSSPSEQAIVVSASGHRHIRRRTLFGDALTTGPNHRLHSMIFLNINARTAREAHTSRGPLARNGNEEGSEINVTRTSTNKSVAATR